MTAHFETTGGHEKFAILISDSTSHGDGVNQRYHMLKNIRTLNICMVKNKFCVLIIAPLVKDERKHTMAVFEIHE